ncbi:hypothetical protein ID866_11785 [Astraeus odoratus]|nr:hypothetical protein ID866_11785 [Astraeus odoratus]
MRGKITESARNIFLAGRRLHILLRFTASKIYLGTQF